MNWIPPASPRSPSHPTGGKGTPPPVASSSGSFVVPWLVLMGTLLAVTFGTAPLVPVVSAQQVPRVLVFDEALQGAKDREVRWPVGVAAASDDEIAVADAKGSRVLVFRRQGVGWEASQVVTLPGPPAGIAWDGGRYLVSLRSGGGLLALEGADLLQRAIALPPDVAPGPMAPVPSGGALVYDFSGKRVLRLGADGKVAGETAVEGPVTGVAATAGGGLAVACGTEGVIRRYDATGALQATWELPPDGPVPAWPTGLAVEPGGDTLVADHANGRILVLDPGGRLIGLGAREGWDPGLLLYPAGLARLPGGGLVVADQGNGRIQLFHRVQEGGGS